MSLYRFGPRGPESKAARWMLAIVLSLVVGGAFGLASLLVFPRPFLKTPEARVVNLVLSPIAAGAAMYGIGRLRRSAKRGPIRVDSFWIAYAFAFAMTAVRFIARRAEPCDRRAHRARIIAPRTRAARARRSAPRTRGSCPETTATR